MRPRHKRVIERPIHVHVHIDDGLPKCPFCGEWYDRSVPMIGEEGVTLAYIHDRDDDEADIHFTNGVMRDTEHDIDCDEFCFYEIGGESAEV